MWTDSVISIPFSGNKEWKLGAIVEAIVKDFDTEIC